MLKDANGVPFSTRDGQPPATPTQPVTIFKPSGQQTTGWLNGSVVVESNSGGNK
jgi:hypothetical protein